MLANPLSLLESMANSFIVNALPAVHDGRDLTEATVEVCSPSVIVRVCSVR